MALVIACQRPAEKPKGESPVQGGKNESEGPHVTKGHLQPEQPEDKRGEEGHRGRSKEDPR